MSWDVHDDVWLAPIQATPASQTFDELDVRVVTELLGPPPEQNLPPPPPSAAFDQAPEATSYESGRFVMEPEPEPEPAPQSAPQSAPPQPAPPSEPEPAEFVIPTLARPVDEPDPEIGFVIPSLRRVSEPNRASSEGELFIPSLRRPEPDIPSGVDDRLDVELQPADHQAIDEELEEVDDLEEVVESPVRTGETVVGPAPTGQAAASHSSTVADSVYDDDDHDDHDLRSVARPVASPESIQRVDSAELELLPEDEDTAVGYPPDDEGQEAPHFVIPALAAPAVVGITPAEIFIPLLTRAEPESPSEPQLPDRVGDTAAALPDAADLEGDDLEGDDLEPEEVEEFEVEDTPLDSPEPLESAEEDAPEVLRPPTPPPSAPAGPEKRRKGWYDDVFAEHYQFLYPPTWEETARRDAEFIHTVLGLPAGGTVLDVGCGDGRHALELGKLGLHVTGLDNSLALLLAAAQHKEQMGVDDQVAFLHGDMRRLPRDRQFDAVMCVGSTLGYFEEEQNRLCLDEMLERLAPTGRLLLHVFNRDFVAPQLPARSWWQGRRCMVLDEAEMNFFANRLRVHRTIIFDDGRQFEHYMFMRAFTVHDLGKTLSQMGMRVVEVSGSRDTRKRFYGAGSPDIWIVAERKT